MDRAQIARRRAVAVFIAAAATALIWFTLVRDDHPAGGTGESAALAAIGGRAGELARRLPLPELARQLVLSGFEGTGGEFPLLGEFPDSAPGGVLIDTSNWPDATSGTALVAQIRAAAKAAGGIEPLLAVRQEGGDYRALVDLPPDQREAEIGAAGDRDLAERWSFDTAHALAAAGIDLNLTPVADVATLDSPIADRAFSDDAQLAAAMTASAVRGCRKAGIACAAAHFPGLGAASQSTDEGPATVGLDAATLHSRDLIPFEAAIGERVPAVVVSHAFYSAYDPVTPASLSPQITTGLLRNDLGFEGVAISDDIGAGAIRAGYDVADAAVQAVNAGIDMVLVVDPGQADKVAAALVEAASSGAIDEGRLREAAARVLALKESLGLRLGG